MAIAADLAQTFFLDRTSVKDAEVVFVSNVQLYFRNKPSIAQGGVTVFLCPTYFENGFAVPDLTNFVTYGRKRLEYSSILTSTDGSAATTFTFPVPVPVKTDATYAMVIRMDFNDNDYTFWANKTGETYNNVASPAVTKGALDGRFFVITNGTTLTPQSDTDLKFTVNFQKFITNSNTYSAVNRNMEFLNVDPTDIIGDFIGGELVFANTGAVAAQTVSMSATSTTITGTGTRFATDFNASSYIVLKSGTSYSIRAVDSVVNNTTMILEKNPPFTNSSAQYLVAPVGKLFKYNPGANSIILVASTANSTFNFYPNTTSNTVVGEASNATAIVSELNNFLLTKYESAFNIVVPPNTYSTVTGSMASATYSAVSDGEILQNREKWKLNTTTQLFSRSDEVANGATLTNNKSFNFNITFSSDNEFTSPFLDEEDMFFFGEEFLINNDITDENKPNGNAVARHISKRITLADGQDSEDIRVYLTAFRPSGTDVHVYVRFYNESDSDVFTDKDWTRLEPKSPATLFSSAADFTDFIELEYRLPAYPVENYTTGTKAAGTLQAGKFTIPNNSLTVTGTSGTVNTGISQGDVVRIYDPLFPNNSLVVPVSASTTTNFTIDLQSNVSTSNTKTSSFVKSGMIVEKVTYKNTAFKNYIGNNVVRYYNSNLAALDTYKSFAFKIILTSSVNNLYPFVDDIRGIAMSI